MRLDFPDYTKLVLADLDRKRRCGGLPPSLSQPTPGGIRRECAIVYKERFDRKDELVLRNFFGSAESGKQLLTLIEGFPIDKFRPLVNYLKGGTENTDTKNLELLAWLIDFRHRPYGFGKEVLLNEEEIRALGGEDAAAKIDGPDIGQLIPEADEGGITGLRDGNDMPGQEELPESDTVEEERESDTAMRPGEKDTVDLSDTAESNATKETVLLSDTAESDGVKGNVELAGMQGNECDRSSRRSRIKNLIIACLITAICTSGIVAHWMSRDSGCMYWANDHYEKIACDAGIGNKPKVPLDVVKLKSFRKIMRKDTITRKSIGKIYYATVDGEKEFYTSRGYHPIDTTQVLRVLSPYIYYRYIKN